MNERALLSPDELASRLRGTFFALDVETAPLPDAKHKDAALLWHQSQVVAASIACLHRDVATFLPLATPAARGRFVAFLKGLFADPATTVVGHNLKFDLHALGIAPDFAAGIEDTSVLVHLCDANAFKALESAEFRFLRTTRKADHLAEVGAKSAKTFSTWPVHAQAAYAGDDAVITYELREHLLPRITRLGMLPLFRKEMRFLRALWHAERRGVFVDWGVVQEQQDTLHQRQERLEKRLYALAGKEFLPSSPQQLSKVLYDDLALPRPVAPAHLPPALRKMYTSTATSSPLLMTEVKHPISSIILALRESVKLQATLATWWHLRDAKGLLHTSLNQTGARTGRLTSSRPNLLNLASSKRRAYASLAEEGVYEAGLGESAVRDRASQLRRSVRARPGFTLVRLDMKLQEIRMLGVLSQEPRLLARLEAGGDVHREVAELLWHNGDDTHRSWAKTIAFALLYGLGTATLAAQLGLSYEKASSLVQQYWALFPGLSTWTRRVTATCKHQHAIRNWAGRLWREDDPRLAYKAVNALIQGSCADLFSVALLRCHRLLTETGAGFVLLPIYDELLCEVRTDALRDTVPALQQAMEVPDALGLPFLTESQIGPTYSDLTLFSPP